MVHYLPQTSSTTAANKEIAEPAHVNTRLKRGNHSSVRVLEAKSKKWQQQVDVQLLE